MKFERISNLVKCRSIIKLISAFHDIIKFNMNNKNNEKKATIIE